jgi:hypothetical protein
MAYFNHAFHKCFVATAGNNPTDGDAAPSQVTYSGGIITDGGVHVSQLKDTATYGLGPGVVGFFGVKGANKDLSLRSADLADCCPFYLASSSIRINDKQGPFHTSKDLSTEVIKLPTNLKW